MKHFFFLLFFGLVFQNSYGQLDPVVWSFSVQQTGQKEYVLKLTASIEKGWYVYSQFLESDEGPVATTFVFDVGEEMKLIGKTEESGTRHEGFDSLFNMNIIKYSGKPVFSQKVEGNKGNTVKGTVTFMTCDDEKCLPPKDIDFVIALK
jgi:thiol:disulfide interchange protein DsbD